MMSKLIEQRSKENNMPIDKALYAAPQGIEELAGQESPIEIEIEDPESVSINAGGLEVVLEPGEEGDEGDFNSNLAEYMTDGELEIGRAHV